MVWTRPTHVIFRLMRLNFLFVLQPLDLGLLGLHHAFAGECLLRVSRLLAHPFAQLVRVHVKIARGLRHRHTPALTSFTASSLDSRQ